MKFINSKNISDNVKSKEKDYSGLELKFELDITPVAEIEVIINKNNGHGLKGRGRGSLLMEINTLGKFNMWGDFQVYDGVYNFKYGGFIDKKIKVKNGGYISWDGDPLNATLNMEAIYKTEANPSILLDNPSFNKKIPTEVVIKLTDKLTNPKPDIFINFPTVNSVLRSEIDYKLNDFDTRQKQALSLISSGSFLSDKGVVENVISGNILERANSLFDELFANDERFKLGLNYVQNDRLNQETTTGGRVGFTVSTQISDKITINGKFGVPVGGINESVVVGDVEVQLRLNEDGSLKARVFNRENDITYLGQGGIGYTQGLGLSYEVDFNTFKELMYKVFNSKKIKDQRKSDQQKDQIPDSDLLPEIIQFTEKRNKKSSEKRKEDEDRIPELN
ncbi:translocation/assembly module TamB domain-containing protein [Flavobacterium davisii]|uniref:translocation/assembly module TamB domain-containing protein n=1 Tax=Flavobacterium davisii TaxID=2906077 RepID=UPI002869CA4A|nr:translocation/assembly module TamB domain-containing protein [Flavobacterium davisii]